MKATICKRFSFDAAHELRGHEGLCRRLHGHTYHVEIYARGPIKDSPGLTDDGMVMDFGRLNDLYAQHIKPCDHRNLSELFPFRTTSENLAAWMLRILHDRDARIFKVRVAETLNTFAEVCIDDLPSL